jgi:lipopolysaccharide transport system permease protein
MSESSAKSVKTAAPLQVPPHGYPRTSIEPPRAWSGVDFRELWDAREMLYFLIWRDLKVRYKQTALGASWIVVQPLATMLIFSIFFGRVAKMPSDGLPYPIFFLTALVPWNLFSGGLGRGADSLVNNSQLLKKVYLPRISLPLSRILGGFVDFGLSLVLLGVLLAFYRVGLSFRILVLPLFLLLTMATTLGAAFWLSALNVRMRDIQQAVPFITQLWFYASPVAYPSSLIHGKWHRLYGLNPMATVVEGFRWALLGTHADLRSMIIPSCVTAMFLLVSGALFFRKMEQTFADIV